MHDLDHERRQVTQLERVPVVGRMAVDAIDAWLGLVDAMFLGGLRRTLLTHPDSLSPRAQQDDRLSPRSNGCQPDDVRAARSLPLPDRAA